MLDIPSDRFVVLLRKAKGTVRWNISAWNQIHNFRWHEAGGSIDLL